MGSVRQVASAAFVSPSTTATFALPVLASSRLAAFINSRGNPSSFARAGWTMNAGVVIGGDQHMAGRVGAGVESGLTALTFSTSVAGGGQLVVLELDGVDDLRQWAMTDQTQNHQPCLLPLPAAPLAGSLLVGLFCMRPPDAVAMTGIPIDGYSETSEDSPSAGGLHPWEYVASRVVGNGLPGAPGVTSAYDWFSDAGAGFAGTALEYPVAAGGAFFGEPGGGFMGAAAAAAATGSTDMQEIDYVPFTSDVSPTATTEATADTVVTGSSVAYDGVTPVVVEFFAHNARPDIGAASRTMRFWLYQDGVSIGSIGLVGSPAAGASNSVVKCERRITPSAGSHTYSIRASVNAGTGQISAGPGGIGNFGPGFIRILR